MNLHNAVGARTNQRNFCKQLVKIVIVSLLFGVSIEAQKAAPSKPKDQTATFTNPIVTSRDAADPWMIYKDGFYYFTFTAGNHIEIWKSATITGIDRGVKVTVYRPPASTGMGCCNLWAPELHFLNNRWYIYFAADDGNDANHRLYVLESIGVDPQGAYINKGKIAAPSDRWAIDGTVLQKSDGSMYLLWSGWTGATQAPQNIYIAPMSNPWTISAERVLISSPVYAWERVGWWVNEGPEALQRNGKIFVAYSASGGSTQDYCLGLLTNANGNVLDPNSWTKSTQCVFAKTDQVFGPGHNSFVKSPDGTEDWLIYHARNTPTQTWSGRTARAQRFSWHADGTPDFGAPAALSQALPLPSGEIAATPTPTPTPSPTPTATPTPLPAPQLLTEENSEHAIALDSVTLMHDPFPLFTTHDFGADGRTRVMLFAANVGLQPGEDASIITAQAEDAQRRVYPLPVEFAGVVPDFNWLTEVVVKLPDQTSGNDNLRISIIVRGMTSNRASISIAS